MRIEYNIKAEIQIKRHPVIEKKEFETKHETID